MHIYFQSYIYSLKKSDLIKWTEFFFNGKFINYLSKMTFMSFSYFESNEQWYFVLCFQ